MTFDDSEEAENLPTLKITNRSNRDRKHGKGGRSVEYIDGKDHPIRSERRDAHVQERKYLQAS